jgi:dTDP-4-dehydrorhamnose 3,5-epimerase-like enzyme
MTKENTKIMTFDSNGNANGFLIPLINVNDNTFDNFPQQVYLTVASVGKSKGPHLHKKRYGLFTCIKGNALIVVKNGNCYEEYYTGENHKYRTVQVPPGLPNMLINIGNEDCYIINMPYPAWSIKDQDDYKVEEWGYEWTK